VGRSDFKLISKRHVFVKQANIIFAEFFTLTYHLNLFLQY